MKSNDYYSCFNKVVQSFDRSQFMYYYTKNNIDMVMYSDKEIASFTTVPLGHFNIKVSYKELSSIDKIVYKEKIGIFRRFAERNCNRDKI